MFGNSEWKKRVTSSIQNLEIQVDDLKKVEVELRSQNAKLTQMFKNLGRKIVSRLPISLESLDKSLNYDLIFAEEIESWRTATQEGTILDVRPAHEAMKQSVPGSINIPYDQLSLRLENLPKDLPLLLVCENGIKSVAASELLGSKGYGFIYVLKGGMSRYRETLSTTLEAEGQSIREREVRVS